MLDAHDRGALLCLRTSGTSGSPRSLVRTTASWFDSFEHVTRLLALDTGSRVWVPGPLSGTMNLFAAVHATHLGATVAGTPDAVTHAVLTPAALSHAHARGVDLAGVHVLVAGDRLGRALHDRTREAGAAQVSHYYGAAELSFVAWGAHADDLRPFPGVEVDSRDGVLWVRSPYVCLRYAGPAVRLRRAPDGYLTVGDRGLVSNGRVLVQGRRSDTVVTAGATVLVTEVEAALEAANSGPVAVLGVPHADLGEVLCAVVTDAGQVPPLRARARNMLAAPQRPRRWFEVTRLPVTAAGKVDRARLRDMLDRGDGVSAVV